MHDIRTKALSESVDRHVQPTLPAIRVEEIKLYSVVDTDQIVRCHANQTERPGIIKSIEQINANSIKFLCYISRFFEPALTRQDLEVSGLELYAHAEGDVVLLPKTP